MAKIALNLGDVFFFLFNDIGVCTYCKGVITAIFLIILTPKTSFVLVFFTSLALAGRKLLVLATRYISGKSVSTLGSSRVFFLLFYGFVPLETL